MNTQLETQQVGRTSEPLHSPKGKVRIVFLKIFAASILRGKLGVSGSFHHTSSRPAGRTRLPALPEVPSFGSSAGWVSMGGFPKMVGFPNNHGFS